MKSTWASIVQRIYERAAAVMRKAADRLDPPKVPGPYAVIYDHGDMADPVEEYYGFFGTPAEAGRFYAQIAGDTHRDAFLVRLLGPIGPRAADMENN